MVNKILKFIGWEIIIVFDFWNYFIIKLNVEWFNKFNNEYIKLGMVFLNWLLVIDCLVGMMMIGNKISYGLVV